MSNGIGKNPLTDISKVYLQQIANEGTMDIKGFAIPKSEQDAAKKRVQDKTKKKQIEKGISSAGYTKEGLDPVNPVAVKKKFANRKDRDLDNDGDTDSSDKYLHKRRKAIAGAMKKRMSEGVRDMDPEKGTAERKARLEKKRGMKMDDHPQYKKESADEEAMKVFQKLQKNVDQKKKKMKESFSNWRTDLSEVMTDEIDSKPVKEKKINNKIKINPKLGEAVEALGGEILEVTEVDEAMMAGPRKDAMAKKINTAKSGSDRATAFNLATRNDMGSSYQKKSTGGKGSRFPGYGDRGAGNKAARRMGKTPMNQGPEKRVTEAVYGGTPAKKEEPKDNRMVVTAADKKGNTPAYQRMKAGDKRYKPADHMKEGIGDKLKGAVKAVKKGVEQERKFQRASGETVDRMKRMARHKQDKYGPSTLKQRLKTGAEHNTDNEKKAKMNEASFKKIQEKLNLKKTQWGV